MDVAQKAHIRKADSTRAAASEASDPVFGGIASSAGLARVRRRRMLKVVVIGVQPAAVTGVIGVGLQVGVGEGVDHRRLILVFALQQGFCELLRRRPRCGR